MPFNPEFTPSPVQWGGQQFTDPGALARWLRARGASPAVWAMRHPGAAMGLGMPMPTSIPATPDVQGGPGAMVGPMPPAMGPQHPQVPMPGPMDPQHPQGPFMPEGPAGNAGLPVNRGFPPSAGPPLDISAIVAALRHALQMGPAEQMGQDHRYLPPGPGRPLPKIRRGRKRAIPAGKSKSSPLPPGWKRDPGTGEPVKNLPGGGYMWGNPYLELPDNFGR